TLGRSGRLVRENLAILNRLNQPQSKHLQGNTEGEIARPELVLKIRLGKSAIGNCGIVSTPAHGPELMCSPVSGTVRVELKPHFTNRPELLLKARDDVLPSEAARN